MRSPTRESVRRPAALRAWLTAYAAATATTTSYNAILDAATAGETDKPARQTAAYRELLQRLSLLDAVPAWQPTLSPLRRLAMPPGITWSTRLWLPDWSGPHPIPCCAEPVQRCGSVTALCWGHSSSPWPP